MSLPWWIGPMPAAVAAPAPPDEPPGEASGCQGLRVRPSMGFEVVKRIESSGTLVRPMKMAPARRRLATTAESAGAMLPASAGEAVRCGLALDVDVLLDGERDAVERAERFAVGPGLVGGLGRPHGLVAQVDDDGVERRVDGAHAGDDVGHHLGAA